MIKIESPFHPLAQLEGARIVVLNWRDIQHPQAGGAEQYMHQIARRCAIQQRRHITRDDELRIGQRVHQEHVVARLERHTKVEHRRLHWGEFAPGQNWVYAALVAESRPT